ncbi:MAG: glycosyltransferase involved in cell wall biosynthesis [Rickettsiales bacterium]|jgi:glycosyltransferase involved in cell wall biosynthesis
MPKISVCIASYNHAKYLKDTIQSVLNQSFQDFEIIISDDFSTDNSIEIIKNFKSSKIKLIENQQNNGCSINFNKCLEIASGEYLALLGSDDMMAKNRLENQLIYLEKNQQYGAVFTHAQTINVENKEIEHGIMGMNNHLNYDRFEKLRKLFYGDNFLWAPTAMIKKDVLKNIGFFNPCLLQTQDFELWIRILIGGFDVGLIEEKLTYYRINDNNLSYANKKIDHKFLSRIYFENQKILESFLKIKNTNEICQIFPEIREKYPEMKDQYIPYYIAIEALEFSHKENFKNSVVYRNFAINVFYDLLQNEEKRKYLEDNFQFKTGDFIKLISDNPLIIDLCKNTKNLKALNKLSLPQRLRKSFSKKSQKIKTLFKK